MIVMLKRVIFYFWVLIAYILSALALVCEVDLCRTYLIPEFGAVTSTLIVLLFFCISVYFSYFISKDLLNHNKLLLFANLISRSIFFEIVMLSFFLETALNLTRGSEEYMDTVDYGALAFLSMVICTLLVIVKNNSKKA